MEHQNDLQNKFILDTSYLKLHSTTDVMIRAIIVDDEKDARDSIHLIFSQFYTDEVEIVASLSSVKEAVKAINKLKPELVFLDIEMPNENGLQLFEYFGDEIDFEVVFITAYQKYALNAFRYAALDYLLKPVDYIQLGETIQRFKRKARNFSKIKIDTFINNLSNDMEVNKKVIFPTKNGYSILKMSDIVFCKAEVNYSTIYTKENTSITIVSTLKNLEEMLPSKIFFRCHKSFLVNLDFIKTYDKHRDKIILENGKEIDIATRRVESFIKVLTSR